MINIDRVNVDGVRLAAGAPTAKDYCDCELLHIQLSSGHAGRRPPAVPGGSVG
jgi:hypothetical protein